MAGISNRIPNMKIGALNNDFSALMQIFETYLGLYVMTSIPCVVDSYKDGFVTLKPVLIKTNSTGQKIEITDDHNIYNIPLMRLSVNGWNIKYKAKKGDYGLLIASKYDISNFKREHKKSVIGSKRMFSASDGFFLPLDWGEYDEDGIVIENENTSLTLEDKKVTIKSDTVDIEAKTANIKADAVNLGDGVGLGVARIGDEVDLDTGLIKTGSTKVKAI